MVPLRRGLCRARAGSGHATRRIPPATDARLQHRLEPDVFLHRVLAAVVLRRGRRRIVVREYGRGRHVRRGSPKLHAAMHSLFVAGTEIVGLRRSATGVVLFRIVSAPRTDYQTLCVLFRSSITYETRGRMSVARGVLGRSLNHSPYAL